MANTKSKASKSKKKIDYKDELKKSKVKIAELNKKYKKIVSELEDVNDKHIRLLSEFDNYRKRTIVEKEKLITYDGEKLISSLLPIFDDLDRTISHNHKDLESVQKGIEIIMLNIKNFLDGNEIRQLSSLGEKFDPELHEALMTEPGEEDNIIVKEFEKGYKYKDKIIRHSKVVVSSKSWEIIMKY